MAAKRNPFGHAALLAGAGVGEVLAALDPAATLDPAGVALAVVAGGATATLDVGAEAELEDALVTSGSGALRDAAGSGVRRVQESAKTTMTDALAGTTGNDLQCVKTGTPGR